MCVTRIDGQGRLGAGREGGRRCSQGGEGEEKKVRGIKGGFFPLSVSPG